MNSPAFKAFKSTGYLVSLSIIGLFLGAVLGEFFGRIAMYLHSVLTWREVCLVFAGFFVAFTYTMYYRYYKSKENEKASKA